MSLRTSDRCHWFAAPRLDGNSLVLLPRCLKIRGIATPVCALVRNDRLFSNSPCFLCSVDRRCWLALFPPGRQAGIWFSNTRRDCKHWQSRPLLQSSALLPRAWNKRGHMLRFKCWYYDQAIQDGCEDRIKRLLPDRLPDEIQTLYDHAHQ